MGLAAAPIRGQSWLLADWVELNAISSGFKVFRLSQILRINDISQDSEEITISEQDCQNESFLENVLEEIKCRKDCLGSSYPFEISESQSEFIFEINKKYEIGQFTYLLCLLFSHLNRGDVLTEKIKITNEERDLMQVCATLAAADKQQHSVSFGYPRKGGTSFLDALKKTYELIGEGTVKTSPPLGEASVKDAGIDVISWSSTADGASGRKYLLGQVATGNNWKEKSVKQEIDLFHEKWFIDKPASTPQPAMFIPHCIEAKNHDERIILLNNLTLQFGEVFYRYRLPLAAQQGYDNANTFSERHVERIDDFHLVIGCVKRLLDCLPIQV